MVLILGHYAPGDVTLIDTVSFIQDTGRGHNEGKTVKFRCGTRHRVVIAFFADDQPEHLMPFQGSGTNPSAFSVDGGSTSTS